MIRTLDISHWGKPYANNVLDWSVAAAASPQSMMGLGQEVVPEATIVGQCDFTHGEIVEQLQAELGVSVTGHFDPATCVAWRDRFGEPPTAESLNEAVNLSCASAVVPSCSELITKKPVSIATLLMVGGGIAALGLFLVARKRR